MALVELMLRRNVPTGHDLAPLLKKIAPLISKLSRITYCVGEASLDHLARGVGLLGGPALVARLALDDWDGSVAERHTVLAAGFHPVGWDCPDLGI